MLNFASIRVTHHLLLALAYSVMVSTGALAQSQVESRAVDRLTNFAHSHVNSPRLLVLHSLHEANSTQTAARLTLRWLSSKQVDVRTKLQLAMSYIEQQSDQHLSNADLTNKRYDIVRDDLATFIENSTDQVKSKIILSPSDLPTAQEAQLFFEFASQKSFAELSRYYTALRLASIRNDTLKSAALNSVLDSIESIDVLTANIELRIADLSKQPVDPNRQTWINELYRLANECRLIKVDHLAMQMDQAIQESEADQVAAANSLKTAIEEVSSRLGGENANSPRLNLLRARAFAATGEDSNAIKLLDQDLEKIVEPELRLQNRLLAVATILNAKNNANHDEGRAILTEQLLYSDRIAPELAIAVLHYNLVRAEPQDLRLRSDDELKFNSPDVVAQSIVQRISIADILQQKESIGQAYGDYWRLRAEAILLRHSDATRATGNQETSASLNLMLAEVQQDLLAGRLPEAINRLQQIEDQHAQNGQSDQAFATARRRNALLYELLRKQEATSINPATIRARLNIAERFRQTAMKYQRQEGADDDSMLAIKIAKESIGKDKQLDQNATRFVVQTVEIHLENFPSSTSASDALATLEVIATATQDYARVVSAAELWLNALLAANAPENQRLAARSRRAVFYALQRMSLDSMEPDSPREATLDPRLQAELEEDDQRLNELCSSRYWSALAHSDKPIFQHEPSNKEANSIEWLARLSRHLAAIQTNQVAKSFADDFQIESIDSPEVLMVCLIQLKQQCEVQLNAGRACPVEVLTAIDRELGLIKDCRSKGPLFGLIVSSQEALLQRCSSIALVLHGNPSSGLSQFKSYVSTAQNTSNMIWYGRLLSAAELDDQKAAINLLTRLASREKMGSSEWLEVKADLIYALAKTTGRESALKEIAFVETTAPAVAAAWRKAVEMKVNF